MISNRASGWIKTQNSWREKLEMGDFSSVCAVNFIILFHPGTGNPKIPRNLRDRVRSLGRVPLLCLDDFAWCVWNVHKLFGSDCLTLPSVPWAIWGNEMESDERLTAEKTYADLLLRRQMLRHVPDVSVRILRNIGWSSDFCTIWSLDYGVRTLSTSTHPAIRLISRYGHMGHPVTIFWLLRS